MSGTPANNVPMGKVIAGTSYTLGGVDADQVLVFTSTSPVAVTLPAPGGAGGALYGNWNTSILAQGTGGVTITPGASFSGFAAPPRINGGTSLTLPAGSNCQLVLGTDGNWYAPSGVSAASAGLPLTGGTLTGSLSIDLNPGPAPPALTGTMLSLEQANGVQARFVLNGWGANGSEGSLTFRTAEGTAAAPSASQINDLLGSSDFFGYGATGYSTSPRAQFLAAAEENWTDTAQGTSARVMTTPVGSTTEVQSLFIDSNGINVFGPYIFLSNSSGAINAAGGPLLYGDASTMAFKLGSANLFFLWQDNAGTNISILDHLGNLTINGPTATKPGSTAWVNPSDRNIKQDIEPYTAGLDAVLALNPVSFRYSGKHGLPTDQTHVGLVHDETGHMPEMHRKVKIEAHEAAETVDCLDCSALTFALINAVKALTRRLEALEGKSA